MKPFSSITVFYDGNCPFLVSVTRLLKRFDRRRSIHFTNVAARGFDARIFDPSPDQLNMNMHACRPDGIWLTGFEAVREAGDVIGLGPVVLLTRLPVLRQILDRLHQRFAQTTSKPENGHTKSRNLTMHTSSVRQSRRLSS